MTSSYSFTLDRAEKTRNTQQSFLAKWLWTDKDIAGWDADILALETQNNACSTTVAAMKQTRSNYDTALDQLDTWTGEGLTLLRVKVRNDAEKLASLDTLTADGTSRANKLQEALDWEKAWNTYDNTWAPSQTNTYSTFHTLRLAALQLQKDYAAAEVAVTAQNNQLTLMRLDLDDANEAWYKAATKHFPIGTAEGDLIRSAVPVTTGSTPAAKPAATPPAPTPPSA